MEQAEERLAMLVEAVTNGNSNAASEPEHEEPVTGMEQVLLPSCLGTQSRVA